MKVFAMFAVAICAVLMTFSSTAAAATLPSSMLYPTSAGTPAVSASCPLRATKTHVYYRVYKAATWRYVFVDLTNPTKRFLEASATIVINGVAHSAFTDGVQLLEIPPGVTGEYLVFEDPAGPPNRTFRVIDSVAISNCS